jgi:hypothetical protein
MVTTKTTTRSSRVRRLCAGAAAVSLVSGTALVALAVPASAKGGDDVVARGACSGSTHWKLKAGPDDGRLEVEAEVDSNHAGQTWTWRLTHNGAVSASGTSTTRAPSGSFEVGRRMSNLAGTDTVTLRASNTRNGETCVGTVRF